MMSILHPLTLLPDQIYTRGFLFVAHVELGYWLPCFPICPVLPYRILKHVQHKEQKHS